MDKVGTDSRDLLKVEPIELEVSLNVQGKIESKITLEISSLAKLIEEP